MYNSFQLAAKYISYYLKASNGRGHGIHSPFTFEFITKVLRDKKEYPAYSAIENRRKDLLSSPQIIEVEDFGAGSSVIPYRKRKVSDIARSSLKSAKYSQLLFRIVKHYQPKNIIELGTSLGTSASYLASATNAGVHTFEGSENIAAIATETFNDLGLKNIELIKGNFEKTLPAFLANNPAVGLAFIDGNHRKEPTLRYFDWFLKVSDEHTILIFDDIHWSREMEEAWHEIKSNSRVTLTIDLFFIGLVFFSKDIKAKQDFTIRF